MKIVVNINATSRFDRGLFWSNEHGWTGDLKEATQFTEREAANIPHLPLDGKWADYEAVSAIFDRFWEDVTDSFHG